MLVITRNAGDDRWVYPPIGSCSFPGILRTLCPQHPLA